MKKQFNIKAAIWGGLAALLATALIVGGVLKATRSKGAEAVGMALILCGVSFIWGMFYFGRKRASEKDENPED